MQVECTATTIKVAQELPLHGTVWIRHALAWAVFHLRSTLDGYLGTIRSRRDDRLLDSIKNRVNQKSYQRGVHKGERIEASMYFWPDAVNMDSGLQRQMKASLVNVNGGMVFKVPRAAPQTQLLPAPHLVNDGKANTQADAPIEVNARRQAMMAYLRPAWT